MSVGECLAEEIRPTDYNDIIGATGGLACRAEQIIQPFVDTKLPTPKEEHP